MDLFRSLNGFVYSELKPDEIRLLVISPGQRQDSLHGSLRHASLDAQPQYMAISYAWGKLSFDCILHMDHGYIRITKSLHDALRNFRDEHAQVVLWADAVCIDQAGLKERNHQVSLMARIFSQAEEVLVWLGEATEADHVAFRVIKFLEHTRLQTLVASELHDVNMDAGLEAVFNDHMLPVLSDSICPCCSQRIDWREDGLSHAFNTLTSVWEKPWFQRLWVVQEVALANTATVYAGSCRVNFTSLEFAAISHSMHIDSQPRGTSDQQRKAIRHAIVVIWLITRLMRQSPQAPQTVLEMLLATYDLCTSEPRDRLFAIRSIVKGTGTILPDYSLSLPELYRRLAVSILSDRAFEAVDRSQHMACPSVVLALVGTQETHTSADHISWVPDFQRLTIESEKKHELYELHSWNFCAGGLSNFRPQVQALRPAVLQLRGRIVSWVTAKCVHSQHRFQDVYGYTDDDRTQYWNNVRYTTVPWYLRCRNFAREQPSASACREAELRRLLSHGQIIEEQDGPSFAACEAIFDPKGDRTREELQSMYRDLNPFLAWRHNGWFIDASRVLASTSNGLLGWIPETATVGDVICVFEGAPFPFLLSKKSGDRYTLVGDAYVHGIMHGEAWPEDEGNIETISLV
ncbi:hypothetical protein LTR85_011493 [Meristemomyces frigidus]|nr:hypothetical protein LTR85_011493 [Meristemomyces frigidus]